MKSLSNKVYSIMETFDDLYRAGKFNEADKLLAEVDIEAESSYTLVAYMVVSSWAEDKLNNRDVLLKKVRAKFERDIPDRVEGLMKGFEK